MIIITIWIWYDGLIYSIMMIIVGDDHIFMIIPITRNTKIIIDGRIMV